MSPDSVRNLWQQGVNLHEQTADFFAEMEGSTAAALIPTVTDTAKGRGQSITFTQMAGFYQEPHYGDELFLTDDDFERIKIESSKLTVDWIRNATRINERMEDYLGMRGELAIGLPQQLGNWMGRQKTHQLFMMFLHKLAAQSYVIAGGKADADALYSTDTLSWNEIVAAGVQMEGMGGKPAYVGHEKDGAKNPIFAQCVVASKDALYSLELDPEYRETLKDADSRGMANYIFRGGYTPVRGHVVKKYVPIDHDGFGPVGSPITPKAFLGEAIAPATTAFDMQGGGSAAAAALTRHFYFKDFPKFAYKFHPGDILGTGTPSVFYVAVVNPRNAATDPNKFGLYRCSANAGNEITVNQRLGAAISGITHTTVGEVTWDAAVHTATHPIGSTIVLVNAKGVPIGHSLMLGRMAARRGYGKYRNHRSVQSHEGGFVFDRFITSVFGQAPVEDAAKRTPAALVITHAIKYAGLPLPEVVEA